MKRSLLVQTLLDMATGSGGASLSELVVDRAGTFDAGSGKGFNPVTVPSGSLNVLGEKSAVANNSVVVTPKAQVVGGWLNDGAVEGAGVGVTASELVSGTLNVNENGVHDVRNYANVSVAVATGGAKKSDVNFYDYDGSIVKSYTAAEFAELAAMPSNPTHEGLTAQGWNWSLADAKAFVARYGKLDVGQMYITDDGKTRIYIRTDRYRYAPVLGIAINGTATVDWGDGSTSTITGNSTGTVINTQHAYGRAGDFVISIAVSGTMALMGDNTVGSKVLWKNNTTGGLNRVYQNAIQKVEIGANTYIGNWAFQYCYSLTSITIPYGATNIGSYSFQQCFSLTSITIPSSATYLGGYTFQSCYSLESVMMPNGVTDIGSYSFYSCNSLSSITIPSGVTSIPENAFSSCLSLANITIPDSVTSIIAGAFSACMSLMSITIPDSVTLIGNIAFANCNGLGYIGFKRTTPPTVSNSNAFSLPTDCIIEVPRGTLSVYTSTANYPSSGVYTYVEAP